MKLGVTRESADALRAFADSMERSSCEMEDATRRFLRKVGGIESRLGIRGQSIRSVVDACVYQVLQSSESINSLAPGLRATADGIDDYLDSSIKQLSEGALDSKPSPKTPSPLSTMSTIEEQGIIRDMEARGELVAYPAVRERSEPEPKASILPTVQSGKFLGAPGNSLFVPRGPAAKVVADFGQEGVCYSNGYPDFTPFAVHETPWGRLDTTVEIGHMTEHRKSPRWEFGRRNGREAYDLRCDLGNFNQADRALCNAVLKERQHADFESVQEESPEVVKLCRAIAAFRKANRLTWHECEDGKTMLLVPEAIHRACPHSGGVSLKKELNKFGDIQNGFWD